jgi:hypothetical protein
VTFVWRSELLVADLPKCIATSGAVTKGVRMYRYVGEPPVHPKFRVGTVGVEAELLTSQAS